MAEGYNPSKSKVHEDVLADFLRAPISGNLYEVPGIGEEAIQKLASGRKKDRIENTFQLIGKFLMLKESYDDTYDGLLDCREHCDAFWFWLKMKGINSYRSGIVMAIAEKANTLFGGLYDPEAFEDLEFEEFNVEEDYSSDDDSDDSDFKP